MTKKNNFESKIEKKGTDKIIEGELSTVFNPNISVQFDRITEKYGTNNYFMLVNKLLNGGEDKGRKIVSMCRSESVQDNIHVDFVFVVNDES